MEAARELFGRSAPIREAVDPLLRWAGGKRRLVTRLIQALPPNISKLRYNEPFVGAASLFLALQPRDARLSDANSHLMSCYEHVRNQPDQVHRHILQHAQKTCERYYYEIRSRYNRFSPSAAQAARFIYLNKTCFNGIFRVNREGEFNVPYGFKEPPLLPTRRQLLKVSKLLAEVELCAAGFRESLRGLGQGDYVYLDPPYPPINGTSYFTHYTADRFGEKDQRLLAQCVDLLSSRGARFMMSNADTPLIRELYGHYHLVPLSVTRYVTCKAIKHSAREVLITNYSIRPFADD